MYFQKNDFNYTEHFEQVATRLVNSFKIFLSMNTCYKQVLYVFFWLGNSSKMNLQYTTAQQLYSCLFECKIMCLVSVQDAEMLYLYKPKFQTKLYNYKFHQRSYHFFIIMFTFKKVRFSLETPLIKNNESNNVHNYLKIILLQLLVMVQCK